MNDEGPRVVPITRLDAYTNLGGWIGRPAGATPSGTKNANTAWVPSVILPVQTTASLFGRTRSRGRCTHGPIRSRASRNSWDLNVDLEPIKARRIEKGALHFERLRAQAALVLGGTRGARARRGLILVGVEDGARSCSAGADEDQIDHVPAGRAAELAVEIAGFFSQPTEIASASPALPREGENPGGPDRRSPRNGTPRG